MAYLIKGAHVFAPEDLGVVDVLTVNDKVVAVGKDLSAQLPDLETIDAKGLVMTPGFIDQHIHVTGGGGEGGPKTRTPELVLSELVACGTTSVVGVSGTDGTSRSIPNLLGKVRALQAEGVSAWMYTSNYAYPPTTLTSCVRDDLYFVPEVLGVKIAMGDHRSSFPTEDEVMRLLTQIRVGAMVAGKLGVLHIHLGNIVGPFDMFLDCVKRGMPIQHIRPTHCARHPDVFKGAIEFGLAGGYVDITTGGSCAVGTPAAGVKAVLDAGVPLDVACNLKEVKRLVQEMNVPMTTALSVVTANVAKALQLPGKGFVKAGGSADLNLFDENLNLVHVFANGRQMMRNGEIIVKGTFEE